MIEVRNLKKSYGNNMVLSGISFTIEPGKVYGFIGRNGAGKSTTMNILTGITRFDSGSFTIAGTTITPSIVSHSAFSRIGYLPEEPRFYGYLSGKEYLDFIGRLMGTQHSLSPNCSLERGGMSKHSRSERSKRLLSLVGLDKAGNRRIGGYSRGMKQRLGIAAALYNNPEILVLDEPSSALDPGGRKDVAGIIRSLKERGITIFLSTHILNDIETICDRIGILHDGRIILEDNLENLLNQYTSPVIEIECEGEAPVLKQNMKSVSWIEKIEQNNHTLCVYVKDLEAAKRGLCSVIGSTGQPISGMNIKKATLEDIYLKAVKS